MVHYSLLTFHINDGMQWVNALALLEDAGVLSANIATNLGKTMVVVVEDDAARAKLLDHVALEGLFASEIITVDFDQDGLPVVNVQKDEVYPSPF
jgi:hypothetical protein